MDVGSIYWDGGEWVRFFFFFEEELRVFFEFVNFEMVIIYVIRYVK